MEKPLILIVDDTPTNLQVLGGQLANSYNISLADNGMTALQIARNIQPDLILLDIMMPGIDGFETIKQLKSFPETKDIPVIFLTARSQTKDVVQGFELGAVDYITKPFQELELKVRVKTHVDLRQKTKKLIELSERDGLTLIPNRRNFDTFLDKTWHTALRYGRFLSLMLIDIDYFKRYNDSCGHLAGDDCLKKTAAAIAGSFHRPGDLVARFGGEEFVVVMAETESKNAYKLARRVLNAVSECKIPHPDSPVSQWLTLSIGIHTEIPSYNSTQHHLIDAADKALYMAKENGRNRIETSREDFHETY